MTVQQERPTSVVALPQPRLTADDEQAAAPQPTIARQPGAWVTESDRNICRWMMVGMLALGLFAAFMVTLSARVW